MSAFGMSRLWGGMKGSKGAAAGPEMHSRKEHGGYRSTDAAAHGFKQLDQLGGANANSQGGTIDKETGKDDTSLAPKAIDKPPVPGGTAQHGGDEMAAAVAERCKSSEPKHGELWQRVSKRVVNWHDDSVTLLKKCVAEMGVGEVRSEEHTSELQSP